jgi:hypothetical protein
VLATKDRSIVAGLVPVARDPERRLEVLGFGAAVE